MAAQKLQPTNEEILKKAIEIETKVDLLINAAKEGGGLVPQVDYKELRKMRKKVLRTVMIKVKCKKQCRKGPCRYGASQAWKCYEQFEAEIKKLKKRKLLSEHIPYTKSQLQEMKRTDLLMLASMVGVNIRKILNLKGSKGKGNLPVIDAIIEAQPRYMKLKEKSERKDKKFDKKKDKKKEKESSSPSDIQEVK